MDNEKYVFCGRCGKKLLSQWDSNSNRWVIKRCPYCDECHLVSCDNKDKIDKGIMN